MARKQSGLSLSEYHREHLFYEACTLRDYFACQTLTGLLSKLDQVLSRAECVQKAYEIADMMMDVRGR